MNSLRIIPVEIDWAEKLASTIVAETTIALDVPCEGRVEVSISRGNPIDDGRFHCLSVVRPSRRYTFGELLKVR